jgi:hypothetical protein
LHNKSKKQKSEAIACSEEINRFASLHENFLFIKMSLTSPHFTTQCPIRDRFQSKLDSLWHFPFGDLLRNFISLLMFSPNRLWLLSTMSFCIHLLLSCHFELCFTWMIRGNLFILSTTANLFSQKEKWFFLIPWAVEIVFFFY